MPDMSDFTSLPLTLPAMLGSQYMLVKLREEHPTHVIYAAQQVDIRRDVCIIAMRRCISEAPEEAHFFLHSARAMSRFVSKRVGLVLELMEHDDRWYLVRERIKGEPLDRYAASGAKLSPFLVARLLRCILRLVIWMDLEGIAMDDFRLDAWYLLDHDFRVDNPALAGDRASNATQRYLQDAVNSLQPLLDEEQVGGEYMAGLLRSIASLTQWLPLSAMEFADDVLLFQAELMRRGHACDDIGASSD